MPAKKTRGESAALYGAEQLDGAARAEVAASDADHHQRLGARAYLVRGGDDALELGALDEAWQLQPAGEIRALSGLFGEHPVGRGGGGVVRAGCVKEL